MYDSFKSENLKVLVGLAFNSQLEKLISFAEQFAIRTGAKTQLVHAVEPWTEHPWITTFPGENLYSSVAREAQEKERKEAESRLAGLADSWQGGSVTTKIIMGRAPDTLNAEAVASEASMIVIGGQEDGYRLLPRGFSTALSLAANATVPVMVVPSGVTKFKGKGPIRMMYADDLSPHSAPAFSLALEMALGLGPVDFHHVHICKTPKEDMASAATRIMEMMNLNQVPYIDGFDPESIVERTEQALKDSMSHRMGAAGMLFVDDKRCERHILFDKDPREGLQSASDAIDPDIVIFGRHEFIHRKPFGVGSMPLTAMLNLKKPIVIAPGNKPILT